MDFTFDVAQTPLIGRRILLKSETGSIQNLNRNASNSNGQNVHLNHNIGGTPNSPRRSASLSPADTAPLSSWKRPWLSQSRVRECLVNLLTTCGQRAVGLPKSPSVRSSMYIFMSSFYSVLHFISSMIYDLKIKSLRTFYPIIIIIILMCNA